MNELANHLFTIIIVLIIFIKMIKTAIEFRQIIPGVIVSIFMTA